MLSAAAVEWSTKQGEAAAKQMKKEMTAQQQKETAADVKANKAPKAPVDLIARVTTSIRQQQKAEAESRSSSKMDDLIARVLASSRKSKKEQERASSK